MIYTLLRSVTSSAQRNQQLDQFGKSHQFDEFRVKG